MKVFSLLSRTGNLVNFILDGEQQHSFTMYRCVALQRSVDTGVEVLRLFVHGLPEPPVR